MSNPIWNLGVAAVFSVLVAIAFGSESRLVLHTVPDVELAMVYGAGCAGLLKDVNSCVCEEECMYYGIASYKFRCTRAVKSVCDANGTSKTCDCNQAGVAESACRESATCGQPNCEGCDAFIAVSTVKTRVNLNGEPCSSDTDCE